MTGAVRTTCPYCGVGCGVTATPDTAGGWTIAGDVEHPANFGRLCSKGSALGETLGLEGRLLHPLVAGQRVSWGAALDTVAARFRAVIDQHGPDAVAFYVSGQLLTEDYYVANKLMKGFIGSANIDTNSRLCMASSVAGHRRAFGGDVVPGTYEDLEQADLVVLVGSNLAWCHPVLYQRLVRAKEERGTRVVVIDPRRTATCDIADLHLALKPGADVLLFNGLLAYLGRAGALDQDYIARHTNGFADTFLAAGDDACDMDAVAAGCGLGLGEIQEFYGWFAETAATVTVYSQGVNQSSRGTDKVNAIVNCHLATGRVGKPGMGPFSVTGQPNAMGGREVGGLANQLAAHMGFTPEEVDRVGRFWRAPSIARREGLKAVDLFQAIEAGTVKAVWVMATNPAVSLPDTARVSRALAGCDFVVVSDCVRETDTTALADVLLPALGWGEKDGTVTNSERRISRQRGFLPPPGEAKPDWWIIAQVAARMGWGDAFAYQSPADIFREHADLSGFENQGERVFDIAALANIDYDALEPAQWPAPGTARLFGDGRFPTADGRAAFVPVRAVAPATSTSAEYPLALNTGRIRDQWHTMTRTGGVPRLSGHIGEPFVAINPADAAASGLADGGLAVARSAQGRAALRVRVTEDQAPGEVFAPMHWNRRFSAEGAINALVAPITDAVSGQPELKHTAIGLEPFEPAWSAFLITRNAAPDPGPASEYWSRITAAGCSVLTLAGTAAPPDVAAWAEALLPQLPGIDYHDARRGAHRWARLDDDRLEACLFLSLGPALPARDWLVGLFASDALAAAARGALLSGRVPAETPDEGRIVCACHNVGLARITRAILDQGLTSVALIGAALKAGTNCGSCIPELKELIVDVGCDHAA
ncbi:nitrate reductase [Skermanella stibiiresistens SB22]|uniref:Nitrate reductase n=1 Tax=Skermanella stibiiresistens SB22 TaxID=1385369 RepID=W9H6I7_9PROT|nr:nitrate reductase [Skermanella stibiiresistens]EWY39388.1 nitrate reductase [Skermanella stibiiresistens SB22]